MTRRAGIDVGVHTLVAFCDCGWRLLVDSSEQGREAVAGHRVNVHGEPSKTARSAIHSHRRRRRRAVS
jgi:hypothetical protein